MTDITQYVTRATTYMFPDHALLEWTAAQNYMTMHGEGMMYVH
jgi:hypothetical protein